MQRLFALAILNVLILNSTTAIPEKLIYITGNNLVDLSKEYENAEAKSPKTSYYDVGKWAGFIAAVAENRSEELNVPVGTKMVTVHGLRP